MYYKFGSNSGDDIANEIDTKAISKLLAKRYELDKIDDYDERVDKMKKIIKDKKEFKSLSEDAQVAYPELIDSIVRMYPFKLFNHHLIKFIKANYLNKDNE